MSSMNIGSHSIGVDGARLVDARRDGYVHHATTQEYVSLVIGY